MKKITITKQGFGEELLLLFSNSFALAAPPLKKERAEEKLVIFTENNYFQGPWVRKSRGLVNLRAPSGLPLSRCSRKILAGLTGNGDSSLPYSLNPYELQFKTRSLPIPDPQGKDILPNVVGSFHPGLVLQLTPQRPAVRPISNSLVSS